MEPRLNEGMKEMWLEVAKVGANQEKRREWIASMGKKMKTQLEEIDNDMAKRWKEVAE